MKKIYPLFIAFLLSNTNYAQAPRRVVVEDFTGTWCGFCPRGKTALEACIAAFPTVIGMELHQQDTYETPYSKAIDAAVDTDGYPEGTVDRFTFGAAKPGLGTGAWKSKVTTRMNTTSPVSVDILTNYTPSTRALSVTITAKFVAAASGDIRISCIITEDGVVTPNDPQHNYMNTTVGDPWFGKGDYIPTYVHNGVARTNLANDFLGTAGVIPATVTAGSTYSKTYTYTLPATYDASKVYVVGMVNKTGTGPAAREILNSSKVLIGSNSVGVKENENPEQLQALDVFPNPFSDITSLKFQLNETDNVSVMIYNAYGQLVKKLVNEKLSPGEHTFYWMGTSESGEQVSNGVYYCVINSSSSKITKQLVYIDKQ